MTSWHDPDQRKCKKFSARFARTSIHASVYHLCTAWLAIMPGRACSFISFNKSDLGTPSNVYVYERWHRIRNQINLFSEIFLASLALLSRLLCVLSDLTTYCCRHLSSLTISAISHSCIHSMTEFINPT